MGLHELEAELTMLNRLMDGLLYFRDADQAEAVGAKLRARAAAAIAATAAGEQGDEWLYANLNNCVVFHTVAEVIASVRLDYGREAADPDRYAAMGHGAVALFEPDPGRTYLLGRFPRGSIRI